MSINTQVDETLESKPTGESTPIRPAPVEETKSEEPKQDGEPVEKTDGASEVIDYAAKLLEAEARLKRAEDKIVKLKKQPHSDESYGEESIDEDRVAKIVETQVAKIRDQVRGEMVESEVDDLLSEVSTNPDEQKLIKHIYENQLQKSGFSRGAIREDLLNAKVLANRDALIKSNRELSQALMAKQTLQTSRPSSSATRVEEVPDKKLSPLDQKILARIAALKNK